MSILSWLKAVTAGGAGADFIEANPLQFGAGEEEFHGLNMKTALDAHLAWLHRLEAKLNGTSSENLTVAEVASDHNCVLGKWIHGEAQRRFGGRPEYHELWRSHAEFHITVGEVLNEVVNGQNQQALARLKDIRLKSGQVQLALIRLYAANTH